MQRKVLVLGEARDGTLRKVSAEATAAARMIADGGEVVGLLVGYGVQPLAQEMIQYGVDRVVVVEHEHLKAYTLDGYSQAILQVIQEERPDGIVFGHTGRGRELSPKLAARLGMGLVSDVTQVEVMGEKIVFTRPIFSGKAFEKVSIPDGPVFFTIRPNNIEAIPKNETRTGQITVLPAEIKGIRTIVKEIVRKTSQGVDLSEANIIVSGGRGVKGKEGFQLLRELADVLGAAVGASRGACDAGYCDYSLQIGQTGKVVTPDLYIACGISGAIQHLAGMSNSKVIVAINKDPEANIFSVADYGIVGDLFEVVPLLTEELKKVVSYA